jgi:hypothetical protein
LGLAFEYQGETHYFDVGIYGPPERRKQIDQHKKQLSKDHGITLIEVPFWWNRKSPSLLALINKYRPDLIAGYTGNIKLGEAPSLEVPSVFAARAKQSLDGTILLLLAGNNFRSGGKLYNGTSPSNSSCIFSNWMVRRLLYLLT